MLKKLPIGIQSFREIRENNYLYVDKTQHILKLIETGKVYFLSRPRRFGKSLIINTIGSLFKGDEELFKGLYVYDKWDWNKTYHVIALDLSNMNYDSSEELKSSLEVYVEELAEEYSIKLKQVAYSSKFSELIKKISKSLNKKVVVLIDEYDKPIIDNIHDLEIADANRRVLHDFYQVLKSNDEYLKFVFLTGVSKFSGTSIFSGLNNLKDISFYDNFATMCGYTHNELKDYFKEYIEELAIKKSLTYDEALHEINFWYDGYSWDGINKVYNPFSTLSVLDSKDFSNYWFESGTPTFLIESLKKNNDLTPILKPIHLTRSDFNSFDIENIDINSLLFQTGYLTIKEKNHGEFETEYTLDIPNHEVKNSLMKKLINSCTGLNLSQLIEFRNKIIVCSLNQDSDGLRNVLVEIYNQIPNLIKGHTEGFYQAIFLVIYYLLGFEIIGENLTFAGRIDAMYKVKNQIVITEMKYAEDENTETVINDAFEQIKDRKYADKYKSKNPIFLAIVFTNKNIDCEFRENL